MEEQAIRPVIESIFSETDNRNWKKVQSLFAPVVWLDYQTMSGETPGPKTPAEIVEEWAAVLPGFDKTHHQPSDIEVSVNGNTATAHYTAKADHFLGSDVWTVVAAYDTKLQQQEGKWVITSQKINFLEQAGNAQLAMKAKLAVQEKMAAIDVQKVYIASDGLLLAGNLYLPKNREPEKKYPAIVVTGSWTTVKEQMSGLYAQELAKQGYITLAFDPRYFGESEGEPRYWENPDAKIRDFAHAVAYLKTTEGVDSDQVFAVSVCASSGYMLDMIAKEKNVKAVATVAAWLHDAASVKSVYGGEKVIQTKLAQAKEAKEKYVATGKVEYVPAISTTDENAAMVGEQFDYYLNPKRGAIPQWSADQFAVMSWHDWLNYSPMAAAKDLNLPVLMIHSDDAVLPFNAKLFFQNIASTDKVLHWTKGTQMDFYDQPAQVAESVAAITDFFKQHSKPSLAEESKAVVDNFFVALETGRFEMLKEVFAPDGRQLNPYAPEGFPKSFDGNEAIYKQYSGLAEKFGKMEYPRQIFATENPGFFFVLFKGIIELKAGGKYENNYVGTFKVKDGKVQEYTEYFNQVKMAEAFKIQLNK